jgi:hypothetical protein
MTLFKKALKATLIASMPAIISAQPAMAQAMPDASFADGCNGSALSVAGTITDFLNFSKDGVNGCKVIDKLYNFAPGAFADFDADNTLMQIATSTGNPLRHAIKLSNVSGFQPGPYDFNYSISVVDAPGFYIADWFASAEPNDPFNSSYTLTTDTDLTPSQSITFPSSSITPLTPFPGRPTTVLFANILEVTDGSLGPNGFTNTVTQASIPPDQVPGPLPLLGAATAFGFSRKLRARIKALA